MSKVRGEANLVRRGSTYYFRIRVPTDLQDDYKPLREIRVSLRTSDKEIARQRVREHRAEYEREFAQRRATRSAPPRDLRPEELDKLSKLYLSWRLQLDDDMRIVGHDEHLVEIAREQLQIDLDSAKDAYSRGRLSEIEALMEDFLLTYDLDLNLKLTPESKKRLAYEILKADVRSMQLVQQRDLGEIVDTPPAPRLDFAKDCNGPSGAPGATLRALCDYWAAQVKPKPKTHTAARRSSGASSSSTETCRSQRSPGSRS